MKRRNLRAEAILFSECQGQGSGNQAFSTRLLKKYGVDADPHGFRSSFRDWCAEQGERREVAEACLAHVVGGVEGAYFRSDLFDLRRGVMERWAGFVIARV